MEKLETPFRYTNVPVTMLSHKALARQRGPISSYSQLARQLPKTRSLSTSLSRRQQDPKDTKITSNYTQPPAPRGVGNTGQLPVLPLVAIFFTGTFLFYRLTKSREGQSNHSHFQQPPKEDLPVDRRKFREG